MKYAIYYSLLLLLIISGCSKFEDGINENPSRPTDVTNRQLWQYAMRELASTIENPNAELYVQHLSEKEYSDAQRYNVINFNFNTFYADPMMNLETIITSDRFIPTEGSENNQKAVARILKAYFMWHVTDRWGDVPYTEALKGQDNLTPKYDLQKDIYYALFDELKESSEMIDDGLPITGDLIYDGDMSKWKKLANSIRLIMALRLSKADPEKGRAEFNDALASGVMESNSDNFVNKKIAEQANENYWYNVFVTQSRRWYCISEPLVNYIKPYNDPRLATFADQNESGEYVGLPYGLLLPNNVSSGEVSYLGTAVRQQDSPNYLLTYAQILFAKAEAAHPQIAWLNEGVASSKNNYEQAIENSVLQWNGNINGVSTMLQDPSIAFSSNIDESYRQIAYQRWVHLYLNGFEAWAEWRRTGLPVLTPAPDNNNKPIPTRQAYPANEAQINSVNYQEAVTRQFGGNNDLNGKVWWDKD